MSDEKEKKHHIDIDDPKYAHMSEARRKTMLNLQEPWKKGEYSPITRKKNGEHGVQYWLNKVLDKEVSMKDITSGEIEKVTVAQGIATALAVKALKGDIRAIETILNRVDGKIKENIEVSGPNGSPVTVVGHMGYDLSKLPVEELASLRKMLDSARKESVTEAEVLQESYTDMQIANQEIEEDMQ